MYSNIYHKIVISHSSPITTKQKRKQYRVFSGEFPQVIFYNAEDRPHDSSQTFLHCSLNSSDNEISINRECPVYQTLLYALVDITANTKPPFGLIYNIPEPLDERAAFEIATTYADRLARRFIHEYLNDMGIFSPETDEEAEFILSQTVNEETICLAIAKADRGQYFSEVKEELRTALQNSAITIKLAQGNI